MKRAVLIPSSRAQCWWDTLAPFEYWLHKVQCWEARACMALYWNTHTLFYPKKKQELRCNSLSGFRISLFVQAHYQMLQQEQMTASASQIFQYFITVCTQISKLHTDWVLWTQFVHISGWWTFNSCRAAFLHEQLVSLLFLTVWNVFMLIIGAEMLIFP